MTGVQWFFVTPLAPLVWGAAMTVLGVLRAGRWALALGVVPIGLVAWYAVDVVVLDPYDVAAAWVPLLGALALSATVLGVACYTVGRLAFLRALR